MKVFAPPASHTRTHTHHTQSHAHALALNDVEAADAALNCDGQLIRLKKRVYRYFSGWSNRPCRHVFYVSIFHLWHEVHENAKRN